MVTTRPLHGDMITTAHGSKLPASWGTAAILRHLLLFYYGIADLSGHYTPIEWARIAVAAYKGHGADRVVAETNNGGGMVHLMVTDPP
jgi:hypothetical protein